MSDDLPADTAEQLGLTAAEHESLAGRFFPMPPARNERRGMSTRTILIWIATVVVGVFLGSFVTALARGGQWVTAIAALVAEAAVVFALGFHCERMDRQRARR